MDLKTCRTIIRVIYVVCIILILGALLLGGGTLFYILMGAAMALALFVGVFRMKFWRCPKCGAMLPDSGSIRCQQCHWSLPDNRRL